MNSLLSQAASNRSASLANARRFPSCAAWMGANEAGQARVCAFCPPNLKAQAEARAARLGMAVTHGACPDCFAREMRAIQAA